MTPDDRVMLMSDAELSATGAQRLPQVSRIGADTTSQSEHESIGSTRSRGAWSLDGYVAALLLLLMSAPLPSISSITVGSALTVILLPLVSSAWHGRMSNWRVGLLFFLPLSLGAALSLFSLSFVPGRAFVGPLATDQVLILVNLGANCFALLWGAHRVGLSTSLLLRAISLVAFTPFSSYHSFSDLWKYGVAWAVPVLALLLLRRLGWLVSALVAVALAGLSLSADTRNTAGALALTGMLCVTAWCLRRWPNLGRRRPWVVLIAAGGLAVAVLQSTSSLAAAGVFGAEVQARELTQSAYGGVLGGRVEYGATFGLFGRSPLGLGLGITPSTEDLQSAKAGLAERGTPVDAPYIREQVLGLHMEVHSIAGDLWLQLGVAGIAVSLVSLYIFGRGLLLNLTSATVDVGGAAIFVFVQAVWDLLFSPLYANNATFGTAVGVGLWIGVLGARARMRQIVS